MGSSAASILASPPHCRTRISETAVPVLVFSALPYGLALNRASDTSALESLTPPSPHASSCSRRRRREDTWPAVTACSRRRRLWSQSWPFGGPENPPETPLPSAGASCALGALSLEAHGSFLLTAIESPSDWTVAASSPATKSPPTACVSPSAAPTSAVLRCLSLSSSAVQLVLHASSDSRRRRRLRALSLWSKTPEMAEAMPVAAPSPSPMLCAPLTILPKVSVPVSKVSSPTEPPMTLPTALTD
jgi:hypothetical protein